MGDFSVFGFVGNGGNRNDKDKNYVHSQLIPSLVWIVPHNLNKRCSVNVTDNMGHEIIGSVEWIDNNEVIVTFNMLLTGYVYCN